MYRVIDVELSTLNLMSTRETIAVLASDLGAAVVKSHLMENLSVNAKPYSSTSHWSMEFRIESIREMIDESIECIEMPVNEIDLQAVT